MKTPNWHKTAYSKTFTNATIGSQRMIQLGVEQIDFLSSVLSLPPNAKILDIPCGVGRHALELAKMGYQVSGLDISESCSEIANRKFSHENITYARANMCKLQKYRNRFDVCLNLFSSFGYFETDQDNEEVLKQLISTLKPSGKIVLNLVDRDWLMKVFDAARWTESFTNIRRFSRKPLFERRLFASHLYRNKIMRGPFAVD